MVKLYKRILGNVAKNRLIMSSEYTTAHGHKQFRSLKRRSHLHFCIHDKQGCFYWTLAPFCTN